MNYLYLSLFMRFIIIMDHFYQLLIQFFSSKSDKKYFYRDLKYFFACCNWRCIMWTVLSSRQPFTVGLSVCKPCSEFPPLYNTSIEYMHWISSSDLVGNNRTLHIIEISVACSRSQIYCKKEWKAVFLHVLQNLCNQL